MTAKEQAEAYRAQALRHREVAESTRYGGVKDKALRSAEALEQLAARIEVSIRYMDSKSHYI
jgi:hypothetical protein